MVTHDNRREATGLYLATIEVVTSLAERAEVIAALADRRAALVREDDAPGAKERARQLRDHVRAYVIPRARAEAADLGIFVTSAVRYADKAPFDVVQRIAARGLPVLIVVNRMPADGSDQRVVLDDLRRVLKDTALRGIDDAQVQIAAIAEGRVDPSGEHLEADAAAPVLQRVDELARDRER